MSIINDASTPKSPLLSPPLPPVYLICIGIFHFMSLKETWLEITNGQLRAQYNSSCFTISRSFPHPVSSFWQIILSLSWKSYSHVPQHLSCGFFQFLKPARHAACHSIPSKISITMHCLIFAFICFKAILLSSYPTKEEEQGRRRMNLTWLLSFIETGDTSDNLRPRFHGITGILPIYLIGIFIKYFKI